MTNLSESSARYIQDLEYAYQKFHDYIKSGECAEEEMEEILLKIETINNELVVATLLYLRNAG